MISSTNTPKTKPQLLQSINKLPPNVKFEVVEVFSMKDKTTINQFYDRYMRKGHFSVMFIEGGD
jgi:hypothetical protein